MRARRSFPCLIGLPVIALSLVGAALAGSMTTAPAAAARRGELTVTVTYKGKGEVNDKHEIFVWLFDNADLGASSKPVAVEVLRKNGAAVKFADVSVSPVYAAVAYDEKGDFDGTQGPPPPGTPVGVYTDEKGTPAPVDVKGTAKIAVTFDDSRRMGGGQ